MTKNLVIRNRRKITVDRETPLEKQVEQLVLEGKLNEVDFLGRCLSVEQFPVDMSRPKELILGECGDDPGRSYKNARSITRKIRKAQSVIRHGDAYEFVAWLREMPEAGINYRLAALDRPFKNDEGYHLSPYSQKSRGNRCARGHWLEDEFGSGYFFLVVCQEQEVEL